MNKLLLLFITCLFALNSFAQTAEEAKKLLGVENEQLGTWEELQAQGKIKNVPLAGKVLNHSRYFDKNPDAPFMEELAPFYHGVASGDPLADRIIIWTRVTPDSEEPQDITVKWHVANDVDMTDIIQSGEFVTNADRDYTVKIDVADLEAGTTYYYAFTALGKSSLIGRMKTAGTRDVESVRLAVASCSHYQQGFFTAYGKLAEKEDIDAVIHLGDYIYEYGVESDFANGVREHDPYEEITTKADYRTRHSNYKLDPDLRRLHQQHTFITVWDDHEVANDAWRDGAQNHTEGEEGTWEDRKEAGLSTYFEWMPIRDPAAGENRKVYRTISYGDLIDLIMIDTRHEDRDAQSMDTSVIYQEDRTLLGETQIDWFLGELSGSTAKWRVIGNQVIFTPINLLNVLLPDDLWDAYRAERSKVNNHIINNEIDNIVIITGDFHLGLTGDVAIDPFDSATYNPTTGEGSIAVECVAPSITSANADDTTLPIDPIVIETLALGANPHAKFVNPGGHGYFILDVNNERAQADWYWIEDKRDASNRNEMQEQSWFTADGQPFLQKADAAAPSLPNAPDATPLDPPTNIVGIDLSNSNTPTESGILILANYPNPAQQYQEIHYAVSKTQKIQVSLHDISGKQIAMLLDDTQTTGIYTLPLHTQSLPNGTYICRFITKTGTISRKLIVNN